MNIEKEASKIISRILVSPDMGPTEDDIQFVRDAVSAAFSAGEEAGAHSMRERSVEAILRNPEGFTSEHIEAIRSLPLSEHPSTGKG